MEQEELIKQFFSGNIRALAKILTLVESRGEGYDDLMARIAPSSDGLYCLGVTGPPGAGKSTLVDHIIRNLRMGDIRIGIVAIDPSSPFSGGAVLGDRIRMQEHAGDKNVFIRSLGSRGSHGGLSRATRDIVRAMSAFGFDHIIVETVGVGQTELDIMELADTTIVVLVPEAGDTIQTMKAGLLEIADIFVVNKSDRPASDEIARSLTALVEMNGSAKWKIPVVKTEATRGSGINELIKNIDEHRNFISQDPERDSHRKKMRSAELVAITMELFEKELSEKFLSDKEMMSIVDDVASNNKNPYNASQQIIKSLFKTH